MNFNRKINNNKKLVIIKNKYYSKIYIEKYIFLTDNKNISI